MKFKLEPLNPAQRSAVLATQGPVLVLAGAGSGKTKTMAYRIAHLIANERVSPQSILGLSFTNRASKELKERVKGMVEGHAGPRSARGLIISTFHSLCVTLLRTYAERIGFYPGFTILDQHDQEEIIKSIAKKIKLADRRFDFSVLLFHFGQAKNRFLSVEQAQEYFQTLGERGKIPADYALMAAELFPKYLAHLKLLNAMDFDDLLYFTALLFKQNSDVVAEVNRRFRYLMVDEYQDTNPAQFQLLQSLTTHHKNLCVVGDDDQSIYGWRGAESSHILEFKHQYPEAQVITLNQNYRSTNTILKAANQVIERNPKRHPKSLWSELGQGEKIQEILLEDDRAEAEWVADQIEALAFERIEGKTQQIRSWKDFAILYRSNSQSRIFEEALRARRIPYLLIGGMSFLDRKEVKDLLAYLKLVLNPSDDPSFLRVVNWPPRGIGKTTLEGFRQFAVERDLPLFQAMGQFENLPPKIQSGIQNFLQTIHQMRTALTTCAPNPEALSHWILQCLEWIGARKELFDEAEDPQQAERKWDSMREISNAFGQFIRKSIAQNWNVLQDPSPTELAAQSSSYDLLKEFLSQLMLEARDSQQDDQQKGKKEQDQVNILTLHSAKGLEFHTVFLVGVEDGLLPHQKVIDEGADIAEERRLFYVGMTRAKQKLIISRCTHRIRYGKTLPRNPSRFLQDVPEDLMDTQNLSSTPDLSSTEAVKKHEENVKSYLAQLRGKLGSPSVN